MALKNITAFFNEQNQGIILNIRSNIKNIIFENINITNNAKGNNTGVIVYCTANIENIRFQSITIKAEKMNSLGCIALHEGNVENIILEDNNIYGNSYVGGLTGNLQMGTYNLVQAESINVIGEGNYVGGILGYGTNEKSKINNVIIQDSCIEGESYVGGISRKNKSS